MTAAIALRKPRLSKAEQEAKQASRRDKPDTMMLPGLMAERKARLAARNAASMVPNRISNSSTKGTYKGIGPDGSDHRAGANDFLKVPSRHGNKLVYRDGSTTQITSTSPKA